MAEILMATKLEPLEEGGPLATSLPRFVWRRQASEGLQGLVARERRVCHAHAPRCGHRADVKVRSAVKLKAVTA
jgi:hypothetical protein